MSIWGELDEEATGLGALSADDPETDADEERDQEPDDVLGDGFPDPSLTVRVWLDGDRRLAKVRVSNKWRKRVKDGSLSDLFDDAFRLAYARFAPPPVGAFGVVAAPMPLTWPVLEALADEALDNQRRSQEAWDGGHLTPDTVVAGPTRGHNAHRTVTVQLTETGETERVEFEPGWLAEAKVDELVDAVMEAHRHAYETFTPVEVVPGTLSQLVDANTALALEVDAYLRHDLSR